MKRLLTLAMMVAAASFVFSQPTHGSTTQKDNDEQAVRQVFDKVAGALERADVASLDSIYAADYTLVNESGVITTKAPRLAALKAGELKYESVKFDEVTVRMYGNTAVLIYRVTSKGMFKGQVIGGQFRATSTYVKLNGRWQLVAAQTSPITGQ